MRSSGLVVVVLSLLVAGTAFAADSSSTSADTGNLGRMAGLLFGAIGLIELFRRSRSM